MLLWRSRAIAALKCEVFVDVGLLPWGAVTHDVRSVKMGF